MASPPFDIDETIPGDSDFINQHPSNARDFRDIVESWISVEHDTYGRHTIGRGDSTARDAITTWNVGALWINTDNTPNELEYTVAVDSDVWVTLAPKPLLDTLITGPGTVTDERIALFDGTTGYLLKEASEGILDTVSQAVAEAGTATDRAIWTAERVGQAITALGPATGQWIPISKTTASSDSNIVLTLDNDTYDHFRIVIRGMEPSTSSVQFHARLRRDGQGSFNSGASDYAWFHSVYSSGGSASANDDADSEITISGASSQIDNSEGGTNAIIELVNSSGTTEYTGLHFVLDTANSTRTIVRVTGAGRFLSSEACDAIQLFFGGADITSGEFVLYGMKDPA